MPDTETILVEPGTGKAVSAPGVAAVFKIRGGQTSGGFSMVEFVLQPGAFVPPHLHKTIDEVSYVLEGELGAMVGEEEFHAPAGSCVARPRGVPHALWNTSDRPTRFLDIYTPAGHEIFFEESERMRSSTPPPTLDQLFEFARLHDTTFLPELARPLMQKHGLKMPG